jgi:hypothetical protein
VSNVIKRERVRTSKKGVIRSFLRLLAKKTNSAVDPWVNVTKHALERTSTLASPYTVIIVNDSESAEAIKDVLSLLNNTTAGVGVLLPLDNRWQQWLREGGNLEISVRNAERLPLDLPMTKLLEEKPIISIADSNVFYFVCPLASCTLLKFDTFKEVNMHIIEKHSTEDGDEELTKGKKMKKEEATSAVSSIKVVNHRSSATRYGRVYTCYSGHNLSQDGRRIDKCTACPRRPLIARCCYVRESRR